MNTRIKIDEEPPNGATIKQHGDKIVVTFKQFELELPLKAKTYLLELTDDRVRFYLDELLHCDFGPAVRFYSGKTYTYLEGGHITTDNRPCNGCNTCLSEEWCIY